MYRLVESIKVENRQFVNIAYHNARMNHARKQTFGSNDFINIEHLMRIPDHIGMDVYKCRILYQRRILEADFQPYIPRKVESLKLIVDNNIDYTFKRENRQDLTTLFELRGGCDDVLIVKNGYITDTSFSNVIFLKDNKWFTPKTYLLKGTKRQKLIDDGIVEEANILVDDIQKYSKVMLVNAMLDFEPIRAFSVSGVML